jgi:hypothetical protein
MLFYVQALKDAIPMAVQTLVLFGLICVLFLLTKEDLKKMNPLRKDPIRVFLKRARGAKP